MSRAERSRERRLAREAAEDNDLCTTCLGVGTIIRKGGRSGLCQNCQGSGEYQPTSSGFGRDAIEKMLEGPGGDAA